MKGERYLMRRQGLGLIVNLSPVADKVSMPFAGWYFATKHAVEALSDALRLEVKPFGIRVILVEPGTIKTGFDGIALGELRRTAKLDAYRGLRPGRDGFLRMRPWLRDRCEGGPRAIEAKRPRARYAIGNDSRMLILVRRLLGDGLLDRIISG